VQAGIYVQLLFIQEIEKLFQEYINCLKYS